MSQIFPGPKISWSMKVFTTASEDKFIEVVRSALKNAALKMGCESPIGDEQNVGVLLRAGDLTLSLSGNSLTGNSFNFVYRDGAGELLPNGDHAPLLALFFLQSEINKTGLATDLISLSDDSGTSYAFHVLDDLKPLMLEWDIPWDVVRLDAVALGLAVPIFNFMDLSCDDTEDAFF
ncbi:MULTISPECIES: hypothetical protein [Comamonas]|uniref:hypothetical protein n=1 Tax=Comamonas TaxID=283 RepID=UPI000620E5C4|nr:MULTISPECIES: hypothetical protein [Comamonas]KKI11555.1 hypothetical protein XA67_24280 [Comamonas thiooxydans]UBQ44539.1 hypothetical protein LCH15_25370 [Comamonas thiooxydans]UUC96396.1 hypothetical protein NOX35_27385 [Comamonas sp. C11]